MWQEDSRGRTSRGYATVFSNLSPRPRPTWTSGSSARASWSTSFPTMRIGCAGSRNKPPSPRRFVGQWRTCTCGDSIKTRSRHESKQLRASACHDRVVGRDRNPRTDLPLGLYVVTWAIPAKERRKGHVWARDLSCGPAQAIEPRESTARRFATPRSCRPSPPGRLPPTKKVAPPRTPRRCRAPVRRSSAIDLGGSGVGKGRAEIISTRYAVSDRPVLEYSARARTQLSISRNRPARTAEQNARTEHARCRGPGRRVL